MKISCIPRLFSISHSNYNKNKCSSQCDYERNSKHSKCRYTCEKRRGAIRIYLQSSKQIRWGPTPEKQSVSADHRNALFSFLGKSQALADQHISMADLRLFPIYSGDAADQQGKLLCCHGAVRLSYPLLQHSHHAADRKGGRIRLLLRSSNA